MNGPVRSDQIAADGFTAPVVTGEALARAGVMRRIADAFDTCAVVEILAGPGWGKTISAAQYAAAAAGPPRWIGTAEQLRAALPHRGLLVIDDVHELLDSPSDTTLLAEAVAAAGDDLQVLLCSRRHAGAALRTAVADGRAVVLSENDLRLSAREAVELRPVGGRAGDGSELLRLTGGWIAGASLLARGRDDPRTVQRLDRYIRSAILDGLPPEEQAFLRRTAILDVVSRDDARALLGEEADAQWHSLRRRVLPLVQVTEETLVYRAPLRDLLVADLSRENVDLVDELNERRLAHLRLTGRWAEAIDWCVHTGEIAKAIGLIEQEIGHMPQRRPTGQDVSEWFRLLGPDVALGSDAIAATAIRVLHHERRIDEAATLIRRLKADGRMDAVLAHDPELLTIVLWSLHHRPDDAMEFLPGASGSYRIEAVGYMVAALGATRPVEPPLQATWGELAPLVHWGLIWQGRLDEVIDSATDSPIAFRDNPNVVLAGLWSGRRDLAQRAWNQIPAERRDRPHVALARAAMQLTDGDCQAGLATLAAGRQGAERTAATATYDVLAAYLQLRLGEFETARAQLALRLPAIQQEGRLAIVEWAEFVLALACLAVDDAESAEELLTQATASMGSAGRLLLHAGAQRALAEARLRRGAEPADVADLLAGSADGNGLHARTGSVFWEEAAAQFAPNATALAGSAGPARVASTEPTDGARLHTFETPIVLELAGNTHVLRRTKLAELIADLAVHRGTVDRGPLQLRLFPDADRKRASNHFRQVLFKLRELLGVSLDRPDSESLWWPTSLPLSATDVEFESLVTALLARRGGHEPDAEQLRAALDLAPSAYLPTSELPWVLERRNHLAVLYEEAVLALLRGARSAEQLDLIRDYGGRATALNPYAEDIYLLMLRAEMQWGSQARARAIHHAARVALREIGVDVSVEFQRLAQGLDRRG